jgi:ABC-2 type transport system ATP-binding protein
VREGFIEGRTGWILRRCVHPLPAGLHGIDGKLRAGAVASAKKDCGLADVGKRLVGNLSKGYQQRVGLAQAIIHRPPVVILDEPTVGLDPIQIREIRALITELGKSHSVILSSHILPEIQAVCGRVVIINRGRVVFDESLATVNAITTIFAGFRQPPPKADLAAIPGVAGVDELAGGRFSIAPARAADPREAIARAAAERNWALVELRAEQATLEEIFLAKTAGEEVASEEKAA